MDSVSSISWRSPVEALSGYASTIGLQRGRCCAYASLGLQLKRDYPKSVVSVYVVCSEDMTRNTNAGEWFRFNLILRCMHLVIPATLGDHCTNLFGHLDGYFSCESSRLVFYDALDRCRQDHFSERTQRRELAAEVAAVLLRLLCLAC